MKIALLLLALGFGFKIFAEASTMAKKSLKQLGRAVGLFIMLVSFAGTLCLLWMGIQYGKWDGSYYCPVGGFGKTDAAKKFCPLTGLAPTQTTPVSQ